MLAFSLTAHGVTKKWERKKFLLAVREFAGSHTGARVEEMINSILDEWRIERGRVHTILHDEGSNMLSVCDLI